MSLMECQILKLSRSLEDKSSDAASGRAMGCSREVNRQVVGKPVAPAHWWRGNILGTATRVWRTRNQLPGTVSLSGGCYSSPVSWASSAPETDYHLLPPSVFCSASFQVGMENRGLSLAGSHNCGARLKEKRRF